MKLTRSKLAEVLDEIVFFERERTDRQFVELAIRLYNHGVSLPKVERVALGGSIDARSQR